MGTSFRPFVRIDVVRNVLTARLLLTCCSPRLSTPCHENVAQHLYVLQQKVRKKIHQNIRMRFVDWHDALAVRCVSQRCSCCTDALISTLTLSIVVSSPWERIASRSTSTVQSTKSTRLSLLYRPWALPVSNGCPEKTPRHNQWNCASSLWPCVPPVTQQEKKTPCVSFVIFVICSDSSHETLPTKYFHTNIYHKKKYTIKTTKQKITPQNTPKMKTSKIRQWKNTDAGPSLGNGVYLFINLK